jgi:hypothetical protein
MSLQPKVYRQPCGCLVEQGTERLLEMCACCTKELNDTRHAASAAERAAARAKINAEVSA